MFIKRIHSAFTILCGIALKECSCPPKQAHATAADSQTKPRAQCKTQLRSMNTLQDANSISRLPPTAQPGSHLRGRKTKSKQQATQQKELLNKVKVNATSVAVGSSPPECVRHINVGEYFKGMLNLEVK